MTVLSGRFERALPDAMPRSILLQWRIDPRAAGQLGLIRSAPPAYEIELRFEQGGGVATMSRWIGIGGLDASTGWSFDGEVHYDADRRLLHIDAGPAVSATLKLFSDGSAVPLYARSEALERSGLAGGRYELAG
ncbi:MAG: hypothetical protein AAFR38_09855 [Planctomycetota bacterium]